MEEKRNLKPILLKFGVVLAISFAGFLYSRFRIRKKRPRLPPPSSSSSGFTVNLVCLFDFLKFILNFINSILADQGNKVDLSRGRGPKLDNQAIKVATSASFNVILFAADAYLSFHRIDFTDLSQLNYVCTFW